MRKAPQNPRRLAKKARSHERTGKKNHIEYRLSRRGRSGGLCRVGDRRKGEGDPRYSAFSEKRLFRSRKIAFRFLFLAIFGGYAVAGMLQFSHFLFYRAGSCRSGEIQPPRRRSDPAVYVRRPRRPDYGHHLYSDHLVFPVSCSRSRGDRGDLSDAVLRISFRDRFRRSEVVRNEQGVSRPQGRRGF